MADEEASEVNILPVLFAWPLFSSIKAAEPLPEIPELECYYFAPQGIPLWLKGHEELLPSVAPSLVKEMTLLMNYWNIYSSHEGGVPFAAPQYETDGLKALRRIAELKEQASNALLWLYTYEQEDNPGRASKQKSMLIERIAQDPVFSNQMLPLLRQQVAWLTEKFQTKPIDPKYYSDPINQVIGYFLTWGDDSDVEALRQMLKLLRENAQDTYAGRQSAKHWTEVLESEFEGPLAHRQRKNRLYMPGPVWQYLAFGWDHQRDIGLPNPKDNTSPTPTAQVKPSLPQAVTPTVAKVPMPEPQDHSWMLWLLAVFAALSGLFWLMRKPSR